MPSERRRGAGSRAESRPIHFRPEKEASARIVAVVPAFFPERFPWVAEAVRSAQGADRILVLASYPEPLQAARWRKVDWVFDAALRSPGSMYREAVRRTVPDDLLGILDDDDLWLPPKVPAIREVFLGPVDYFAHAAATVRDGVATGLLGPQQATGTMTVVRRELFFSPRVRPFFDRLQWGCEPFLRYAPLAAGARVERSNEVLAHVRYHDGNSSHPPKGYRRFVEWQQRTSERYLAAWQLIDEMTRPLADRPAEVGEKIAEFTRLFEMSFVGRGANYLVSQQ